MAAWIPAAISAVAGLGQSVLSGSQSRRNVRDTNRAQREMADYAHNQNIDMWNRMNEYNHPQAQMGRFAEAGLNPHLVYGQGTPGQAQSMPEYNAPTQSFHERQTPFDVSGVLSHFQDMKMQKANIDYQKQRTDTDYMREWLIQSQRVGVITENRLRQFEYDYVSQLSHHMEGRVEAQVKREVMDASIRESQAFIQKKFAEWAEDNINPSDTT